MANRILILFAHPRFENSRNHSLLAGSVPDIPGITFHDLYEKYPDFNIDTSREKQLILDNDIIVWQHPFYWYSSPPLLKQWIDLVLEFGWAYGPGGNALQGKLVFNAITAGGPRSAYSREGYNRFTLPELLAPFDQTAVLCKMTYLPPFVIHGTHRITDKEKKMLSEQYSYLLKRLSSGEFSLESIRQHTYFNDWIESETVNLVKP